MAAFGGDDLQAATVEDSLRKLSANEKMIARFNGQLSSAKDEKEKQKLRLKIQSLEQQNIFLRKPAKTRSDTKALEELTGVDWKRLSMFEKQRFIYTAIGGLERQGVFITRTGHEYLEAMDKLLHVESSLWSEYLDNLFVFCVYDREPQTRDAIRRIRNESKSSQ
jgi:hypothetical protein